jgi:hypothetical protein
MQALGVRLDKAATAEESSRREKTTAKSRATHELEIRRIVQDIKKLLVRIEDAIPLINLAITTSGASLSTTLPASVSPSRLLQASTFLTAGDTQYSASPNGPVQVGPYFTLSLYMLFAGHSNRANDDTESMRDATWKEVIHKARVKLVRVPCNWDPVGSGNRSGTATERDRYNNSVLPSLGDVPKEGIVPGVVSANEYAYQLEIIEDFDDDRVHSFDEDELQPGPYGDVRLAGVREFLPIHQISRIFYADTGKILNICREGETNNPVLLLKRDINALPPRKMMQDQERNDEWLAQPEEFDGDGLEDEAQGDIDQQIRRESFVHLAEERAKEGATVPKSEPTLAWQLPPGLDPEWLAFEVYTEPEEETDSEDGQGHNDDSAYASLRPNSSEEEPADASLTAGLADLNLDPNPSPPPSIPYQQVASNTSSQTATFSPKASPFGPIRSSLSLLEMLIRLTALQQFQQASHLAIPDEYLVFFLEGSSTTGAEDGDERRRIRREARQRVGFDPYDESPIKRHGEEYQYQNQGSGYERGATPYEYEQRYENGYDGPESPRWTRERSITPQGSPEPWLLRSREGTSSQRASPVPSSPIQSYRQPARRPTRPLDRVMQERGTVKNGSPLGRGMSVETDSTLGTSPGSPTLVNRMEKIDADTGE